jgi:hypothetical protein
MTPHPKYIQDPSGERMVLLSEKEYNSIIQENESLKLFDKVDDFVLTQEHKDILLERQKNYLNGGKTYSWEEAKQRILKNVK